MPSKADKAIFQLLCLVLGLDALDFSVSTRYQLLRGSLKRTNGRYSPRLQACHASVEAARETALTSCRRSSRPYVPGPGRMVMPGGVFFFECITACVTA